METERGILVTAGRSGKFLLPGGGAESGETRTKAAVRELREETGLKANSVKFLFRYQGSINTKKNGTRWRDHHTVCLIRAYGHATPRHEIKLVAYYTPGCDINISRTTKAIIEKYYREFRNDCMLTENY
ncbi:MAG: NUDIX domain-containing protein [Dehalogenimonas sp.]|uniref:NUDIX domain-containing protein n=1 Tax=Candidatus Dehalogenimonas loeffleri TaxID=3127115 RepID=A0ABZ2J1I9_9CHLR|nr:NUDIX domain-containing protein [Dehalogenimonas sp.]